MERNSRGTRIKLGSRARNVVPSDTVGLPSAEDGEGRVGGEE